MNSAEQDSPGDGPARRAAPAGAGNESENPFDAAEIIYSYTRKQAVADGVQIDVTEIAREAGLKFPVFLTRAVWENYVRVPEVVRCQDEKGRLWDIMPSD